MVSEPTATQKAASARRAAQASEIVGAWLDLSPFQQAKAWEKSAPDTSKEVLRLAIRYANHQLAFQWADRIVALASVVALGIIGWHYADVGAPASGLAVFSSGALASAGAVVGLRWVSSKGRSKSGR